jgi:hypothetical protein
VPPAARDHRLPPPPEHQADAPAAASHALQTSRQKVLVMFALGAFYGGSLAEEQYRQRIIFALAPW